MTLYRYAFITNFSKVIKSLKKNVFVSQIKYFKHFNGFQDFRILTRNVM